MSFEFDAEKTCETCDGEGWVEYFASGYDGYGNPLTDYRGCRTCEGRGYYHVHMRPIDFEDLDEIERRLDEARLKR